MLDPSAGSEEMLTGGGAGDRDLLQLFLLERTCTQPSGDFDFSKCLVSQASILHVCSWAPFQSEPAAHCRQKSGQADRAILLRCSSERHNAHAALNGSSAVPTGLVLTQISFCQIPGHKTNTWASSFENNTLRGMALPVPNSTASLGPSVLSMSLAISTHSAAEARAGSQGSFCVLKDCAL